jgi:hypothetical protein
MEEDADDDLFEPATRFIVTTGHASTSSLQRKFKIGYTRAARLVDMMEARGVVGGLDGAKPREILMSRDGVDDMFANLRSSLSPNDYSHRDEELEGFFGEDGVGDAGDPADSSADDSPADDEIARRGGAAGWSVADEEPGDEEPVADEDPFTD